MIISAARSLDGACLTRLEQTDDEILIHHTVDNTSLAEQAKFIRENTDRGFTADRQMQLVGYIPFENWVKEGLHKRPIADAFKYLETAEEMRPFKVSEKNTGNSGRIIIK